MNLKQSYGRSGPFKSRVWVLNQATEQELLEYLNHLLVMQREQQNEMMALVEEMVEDRLAMQDASQQVIMEVAPADDGPSRTPWLSLGLAGLAGYLIGRHRN